MSYRDTSRAYVKAATTEKGWLSEAGDLDALTRGVPRHKGTGYQPIRTARRHIEHVEQRAEELRKALAWYADDSESGGGIVVGGLAVADAARALLVAIGEEQS